MATELVRGSSLTTDGFRWKTSDGKILRIAEMETSHVFNSMKMIFNHLAVHHGGDPVWFEHQYRDYHQKAKSSVPLMAATVVFFAQEIERRGNLPERYREPFDRMISQMSGVLRIRDAEQAVKAISC